MKFSDIIIEQVEEQTELAEANPAAKILPDARMSKMLALAVRHDSTIPRAAIASLGPRATDEQIVQLWSNLMDKALSNTNYGDLSREGKFDGWLTRLYVNQVDDYESIAGEGVHALGAWAMLSARSALEPQDQDFNKFRNIHSLQRAMRKPNYQTILQKIKDAEQIEAMKRDKKEVVLLDSPRFFVTIPLNFGSCYTFNNALGVQANFCTGSSSGQYWFERYASDGPMISIIDKRNMDHKDGKWQLHAATKQIVDANQTTRGDTQGNDRRFAELFPGLLKQIVHAMEQHAEELKQGSTEIARGGWNIPDAIDDIKKTFPASYASEIPEVKPA